jgi:hypothetical protein
MEWSGGSLDAPAQSVAVHLRHDDVADDEGRLETFQGGERFPPIRREGHEIAFAGEKMLQQKRLRRAVFHQENLRSGDAGRSRFAGVLCHIFWTVHPCWRAAFVPVLRRHASAIAERCHEGSRGFQA